MSNQNQNQTQAANPSDLPPLPADHLNHPENWVTGGDPATAKQKAFVKTLESQHPDLIPGDGLEVEGMGKTEASEVIDSLKSGKPVEIPQEKGKDAGMEVDDSVKTGSGEQEDEDIRLDEEQSKVADSVEAQIQREESKAAKEDSAGQPEEEKDEQVVGEKRKAPAASTKATSSTSKSNGSAAESTSAKSSSQKNGNTDETTKGNSKSNGTHHSSSSDNKQTTLDDVVNAEKDDERQAKKAKTDQKGIDKDGQNGDDNANGHAAAEKVSKSSKTGSEGNPIKMDKDESPAPAASEAKTTKTTKSTPSEAQASNDDATSGSTTGTSAARSKPTDQQEPATLPGDDEHLDHPENWTTGDEPATEKQKGYLKVLEKQKGAEAGDVSNLGKSEASEKIDEMKNM